MEYEKIENIGELDREELHGKNVELEGLVNGLVTSIYNHGFINSLFEVGSHKFAFTAYLQMNDGTQVHIHNFSKSDYINYDMQVASLLKIAQEKEITAKIKGKIGTKFAINVPSNSYTLSLDGVKVGDLASIKY